MSIRGSARLQCLYCKYIKRLKFMLISGNIIGTLGTLGSAGLQSANLVYFTTINFTPPLQPLSWDTYNCRYKLLTYRRLLSLVYEVLERVILVRLKRGEDEIENHLSVTSSSLHDLLWFLVLNVISYWLVDVRNGLHLSGLEPGLSRLLDLVSRYENVGRELLSGVKSMLL